MNSETFELIYDGPALSSHQMDVRDLVPALQGLGSLIREANRELNGKETQLDVLINSEHKKGCFSIWIDVVQNFPQTIVAVLGGSTLKPVKDILEWMDLFGAGPTGLFKFLIWKNGRTVEPSQSTKDVSGSHNIILQVKGDLNIGNIFSVSPEVWKMSQNPEIVKSAAQMIKPLESPGIQTLCAKDSNGKISIRLTKDDVPSILRSVESISTEESVLGQNTVQAHLRPYDVEFNAEAKTWGFLYGDRRITADISNTDIAREALARRQASPDDLYKVDLEVTEIRLPSGNTKLAYRVIRVLDRGQNPQQIAMFDE